MEPTAKEEATNLVAQLLMYVMLALDARWNPSPILEMAAEATYPNTDLLDEYTATLCDKIANMSEADKQRIMYDGRFKDARRLADWWEAHQEVDKKRENQERKDEYDVNCVLGFIKTELELAKKQNRPLDRAGLRQYVEKYI
jgi:replication initiation and membrane attachment protein DnaB